MTNANGKFICRAAVIAAALLVSAGLSTGQDAAAPEAADADAGAAVAERTIFDGVFTEEQVARGASAFSQNCAVCHGNAARGGSDAPGLINYTLDTKYADQPLFNYFHIMQTTMPLGRGNSLPAQTYADITAHLLSLHGAPAGEEELLPDEEALSAIQIVPSPE